MLSSMIDETYQVLSDKVIGQGQYGRVVECINVKDQNQKLCAKVVSKQCQIIQVTDQKSAQREAEILNSLVNNKTFNMNVVKVYKVIYEEAKKALVVIMEKCETNLQSLIDKKDFTDEEIKDFLKQILNGYQILFDGKILHRDIKPENILINYMGKKPFYKLADFGVGKIYKKNDQQLTKTGTPVYAAPEINVLVRDNTLTEEYKSKTGQESKMDMYSIGMILIQMLQKKLPFAGNATDIKKFFDNLKDQKYDLELSSRNTELVNAAKQMIKYLPSQRASFEELKTQFNTQPRIQPNVQPQFQFPKTNFPRNFTNKDQNPPFNMRISQNDPPTIPKPAVQMLSPPHNSNRQFPQNPQFQPSPQPPPQKQFIKSTPLGQQFQPNKQTQQPDLFLQEFINILQLVFDTYRTNNQNSKVVSLMAQFQLNSLPQRDNESFKTYLKQLKPFFNYDKNQQYGDQYIKLIFGLNFYTGEIDQNIQTSQLDGFKMRQYLNQ